jgi:hypothetical protein
MDRGRVRNDGGKGERCSEAGFGRRESSQYPYSVEGLALLKGINEAVSFLLELAMLAAFAYFGFTCSAATLIRWVVGLGLPAIAIAMWAILLAPNSPRRLPIVPGLALSTALFLAAAALLLVSRQVVLGVIMALASLGNRLLILNRKQW